MPIPVSSVGQLVAVIRKQLSAARPDAGKKQQLALERRGAHRSETFDAMVARRVKSIDADDPQKGRKAFRVFLESALLSHLGEQLINDPQFYQMIDSIQASMEADPEVSKMVNAAVASLTEN